MLRVIEDEPAIREWQRALRQSIEAVATEAKQHKIGFPGGAQDAEVVYSASLDLWIGFREFEHKFWNACGRGDPFPVRTPAPNIEINLKFSDFGNRKKRAAGAVVQDDEGRRYLAHSGGIGGGAPGVSPTGFRLYFR